MLNTIILIRHGRTQRDKTNPHRALTNFGKHQIAETGGEIAEFLHGSGGILEVFASYTNRTVESAQVVCQIFGLKHYRTFPDMRIEKIGTWIDSIGWKGEVTGKYFKAFRDGSLPKEVTSPKHVTESFLKIVSKANKRTNTLIVIGHGSALEAGAYFQDKYVPDSEYGRELGYGGWMVLKRKGVR